MDSNFFDIPFRSRSGETDFICRDGEIFRSEGVRIRGTESGILHRDDTLDMPDPPPDVDFALVRTVLPGWHNSPAVYPSKTLVATDPSMEYWTSLAGQLLAQFQAEASFRNLFVSPFYVMAAWKTYGGRYLSASTPMLMIPNSEVPLVATDGDLRATDLSFKIAGAVCELYFRMRAPETLRDRVGTIRCLEILASGPLHDYGLLRALLPSRNISGTSYCRSLDLTTGLIDYHRICSEVQAMGWKATVRNEYTADYSEYGLEALKFYPFARYPLREVDLAGEWLKPEKIGEIVSGTTDPLRYDEITRPGVAGMKSEPILVEGTGSEMEIETRPLKLTGAGVSKRITRVYLRGKFKPAALTLSVYASRDMRHWWKISERKGGAVALLPHSVFRFYKIGVKGYLEEGENLQGATME